MPLLPLLKDGAPIGGPPDKTGGCGGCGWPEPLRAPPPLFQSGPPAPPRPLLPPLIKGGYGALVALLEGGPLDPGGPHGLEEECL